MKKIAFFGLALILVLALAVPQTLAAAKHRWKFNNIQPAGQIYTEYFNQTKII